MKRTEQKEQTRKHLLNTAYSEFSQKGFIATKTLDIAHAAGLSHGTLFMHFPTREELLIKVVDEFGLKLGTRLQQLSPNQGTAEKVLAVHLKIIEEYESFYTRLVVEGPLLPISVRNRIFMIQSGIAHYLEIYLSKEKKSIPIHLLLNSWLGLIHYYLTNRDLFAPGKSVIATCGKELLNHFINVNLRSPT
jgi:AcrR family transcriptional regulator